MNYIKDNVIDCFKQEIESLEDQLKNVVNDYELLVKENRELKKQIDLLEDQLLQLLVK
tara:strand:+ start:504 stop:677 length:174 start_codon:yes stop_codon:yes gene_type:complete